MYTCKGVHMPHGPTYTCTHTRTPIAHAADTPGVIHRTAAGVVRDGGYRLRPALWRVGAARVPETLLGVRCVPALRQEEGEVGVRRRVLRVGAERGPLALLGDHCVATPFQEDAEVVLRCRCRRTQRRH